MDIPQLRTLISVAELGSLSKAADKLHIAQPALSRQVRLLEGELGVRLFDRHGRGMVITQAGQEVLGHAHRIMGEMDQIRASVLDETGPLRGHVSIGIPPTVADVLAVPLVSAFQAQHPEATLRIVSAYSGHLLEWVHSGQVDVAILFEMRPSRSFRSVHLLEEVLHLIGPPDAGLNAGDPVAFEHLEGRNLLLPSGGHGLRKIVESCAGEARVKLSVGVEADSYSTLKSLVKAGQGCTILPLAPIHDEIKRGHLTHAPLVSPTPVRRLMMSFPTDRATSRLANFAGEVLIDTARDLVEREIWVGRLLAKNGAYV